MCARQDYICIELVVYGHLFIVGKYKTKMQVFIALYKVMGFVYIRRSFWRRFISVYYYRDSRLTYIH